MSPAAIYVIVTALVVCFVILMGTIDANRQSRKAIKRRLRTIGGRR